MSSEVTRNTTAAKLHNNKKNPLARNNENNKYKSRSITDSRKLNNVKNSTSKNKPRMVILIAHYKSCYRLNERYVQVGWSLTALSAQKGYIMPCRN